MLKEGDQAPDIELQTDTGETFRLSDLRGKRVVLYFYPKANTPGCTSEACEFRDEMKAFAEEGRDGGGDLARQARVASRSSRTSTIFRSRCSPTTTRPPPSLWRLEREEHVRHEGHGNRADSTFVIGADGKIEKIYSPR